MLSRDGLVKITLGLLGFKGVFFVVSLFCLFLVFSLRPSFRPSVIMTNLTQGVREEEGRVHT